MNHKFNLFHLSYFFAIIIFMVIVISIPVFKINTSQFHLAIAQQQQQSSQANQISFIIKEDPSSLQGSFFNIDNRTFSQYYYMDFHNHGMSGAMLCQLWLKIILL